MDVKENEEKDPKTITIKANLDATKAKEELKEIENQIDVITKKYKNFKKLYSEYGLTKDILIFITYIATGYWLYKDNILHAIFSLILILVIGQVYKK